MFCDSLGESQECLGDEDGESGDGEEDGGEESEDRIIRIRLAPVVKHHTEVGEMIAVTDSERGRAVLLADLTAAPGPGEAGRVPPDTVSPSTSQLNLRVVELQSDQGGLQLHSLIVNRETDQMVVKAGRVLGRGFIGDIIGKHLGPLVPFRIEGGDEGCAVQSGELQGRMWKTDDILLINGTETCRVLYCHASPHDQPDIFGLKNFNFVRARNLRGVKKAEVINECQNI